MWLAGTAWRPHFLVGEWDGALALLGCPTSRRPAAAASEDSAIEGTGPEGGRLPQGPPQAVGTGQVGNSSHGSTFAWSLNANIQLPCSPVPAKVKGLGEEKGSVQGKPLQCRGGQALASKQLHEGANGLHSSAPWCPNQIDSFIRTSPLSLSYSRLSTMT